MLRIIAAIAFIAAATAAYSATYDNLGTGKTAPSQSAEKQIQNRAQKTDKLNSINTKMQQYEGKDKPADVYDFNRYQQERNKERFSGDSSNSK